MLNKKYLFSVFSQTLGGVTYHISDRQPDEGVAELKNGEVIWLRNPSSSDKEIVKEKLKQWFN